MYANADAGAVLALWERGLGRPAAERDDALLTHACGSGSPRTLGERNAMLVRLHARLFGRALTLRSLCPGCGTAAQFDGDCEALAAQMSVTDASASHRLEAEGHLIDFRLPAAADVAAAATSGAGDEFALRLLERCVRVCTRGAAPVQVRELPASVLEALSHRMEALDPGASVAFAVECPQCASHWDAPFDAGLALWQKIQAAAERVLLEVDVLARAYGWTEPDVLNLSPLRRAAYLQLAAP